MHTYVFLPLHISIETTVELSHPIGNLRQIFKEIYKETKDTDVANKHNLISFKLKLSFRMFVRLSYLVVVDLFFNVNFLGMHFVYANIHETQNFPTNESL